MWVCTCVRACDVTQDGMENDIGDDGAACIGRALVKNKTVTAISLSSEQRVLCVCVLQCIV